MLVIVAIVAAKPVPCAAPSPPTGPRIKVSDASYAAPGKLTDNPVIKPILVTV